jgi:hypothetical protein
LEHFKKLQGNLKFHQNKCHPGDVPDMRRQCAKVADQWAQGVAGRSARFYLGLAYGFVHTSLHEKGKAKTVEKVGGGQTTWLTGHMARPTGHHLASYQLNQVVTPPWTPINTSLPVEIRTHTTFWIFHLEKLPFLV